MNKILTCKDREDLISRHRKEKEKRHADRIKVVLLFDEGWTFEKIAKALFIDKVTARSYLKIY